MTLLAISQRIVYDSERNETSDCLDQRWHQLFSQKSTDLFPVPNLWNMEKLKQILECLRPVLRGVILSGGNNICNVPEAPDSFPERDATEQALIEFADSYGLPVLGICRGMQMLLYYQKPFFSMAEIRGHDKGVWHSVHKSGESSGCLPDRVNSYHNRGVEKSAVCPSYEILAIDDDNFVEAVVCKSRNRWGIMWHPERDFSANAHDEFFDHVFGRL